MIIPWNNRGPLVLPWVFQGLSAVTLVAIIAMVLNMKLLLPYDYRGTLKQHES